MFLYIKFGITLTIRKHCLDLCHMALRDVVRRDDEAIIVRQTRHESGPKTLVGRPGAACDNALSSIYETLHLGERFGLFGYGCHTVETRVATHRDIVHAVFLQAICRGFVLHKEMIHCLQLLAEPAAIPAKEITVGLEDEGDIEQRNASLFQSSHIVEPKLILNEKRGHKTMALHPCFGVTWRVGGQVKHLVGQRIVLSHFIPGGREKGQQDLQLGMRLFYGFDDGPALLKLTQ